MNAVVVFAAYSVIIVVVVVVIKEEIASIVVDVVCNAAVTGKNEKKNRELVNMRNKI